MEKLRKKVLGQMIKETIQEISPNNYNLTHHCYSGKNNLCNKTVRGEQQANWKTRKYKILHSLEE